MSKQHTKKHRGYIGSVEVDIDDNAIYGKVLYTNDLVVYEAEHLKDIQSVFEEAVDDYLATCEELGKRPDKPFSGSTNVRMSPEIHRAAALKAEEEDMSFNQLVCSAIKSYLEPKRSVTNHFNVTLPKTPVVTDFDFDYDSTNKLMAHELSLGKLNNERTRNTH